MLLLSLTLYDLPHEFVNDTSWNHSSYTERQLKLGFPFEGCSPVNLNHSAPVKDSIIKTYFSRAYFSTIIVSDRNITAKLGYTKLRRGIVGSDFYVPTYPNCIILKLL